MSKKALTYLLLGLIVIVWGKIVHQVFFPKTTDTVIVALPQVLSDSTVLDKKPVETPLILNYDDPFLKKSRRGYRKGVSNSGSTDRVESTSSSTNSSRKADSKKWPDIVYRGLMKNVDIANKKIAIVVVNGQSRLMSEGDSVEDVKLLRIFKESIKVSFKNEEAVFPRE